MMLLRRPSLCLGSALLLGACHSTPHDPAYYQARLEPEAQGGTLPAEDGLELAYTVHGSGSPVLVFVHGWACDQSYWTEQVPAFSPRHQVVTVDLGGHGASGVARSEWSIDVLAGDLVTLVRALDLEDVVLVGHSMGGPVSVEAAPQLGDRVIGVVGVDTFHDATRAFDPGQMEPLLQQFERNFAVTCASFARAMFPEGSDPALVGRVTDSMCSSPPEVAAPLMRSFTSYDMASSLQGAGVPVRCVNSSMLETNVEGNRSLGIDFDAVTMEGVGHFLMMEKPAAFNQHLASWVEELR